MRENHVTAAVTKEPEMTHDPNAGNAVAVAEVTYTINYDGKPMANTPVHEDVSNKLTKNGKPEPFDSITGDASTDSKGKIQDKTAIGDHEDGFGGSVRAEQELSTNVYEKKTTQTLTINSPEGYGCKIKETRTMTNADKNGKPSGQYHVKVRKQPQKGTLPPPKPNPPKPKTKDQH